MHDTKRPLKVFLSYASQDKPLVRELSRRLVDEGWIDTWQDEKNLLPGQDWRVKIEEAVEEADVVIIVLSQHSISKEGHVQKELRYAREIALEKPEDAIFLIPLRLDECEVPRGLRFYQWVDYFGDRKDSSYYALIASLKLRYEQKKLDEADRLHSEVLEREKKEKEDAEKKRLTSEEELRQRIISEKIVNKSIEQEINKRKRIFETNEKPNRKSEKSKVRSIYWIGGFALLVGLLFLYSLNSFQIVKRDDLLTAIKQRGYILVATDRNFEPASFLNLNGIRASNTKCPVDSLTYDEMQGFDVDVARSIGDYIGVETCFVTPVWAAVIAGFWKDQWDISIGSIIVTNARQHVLDFSIPYSYNPAVVAVYADSDITLLEELSGQAVCAGTGTNYEAWLKNDMKRLDLPSASIYTEVPANITVVTLETDQECAQSIASGAADFVAYSTSEMIVDMNLALGMPIVKLGGVVFSEDISAAFDKSSTFDTATLRAIVDEVFMSMHGNGQLSELSNKWFGFDSTQLKK